MIKLICLQGIFNNQNIRIVKKHWNQLAKKLVMMLLKPAMIKDMSGDNQKLVIFDDFLNTSQDRNT